MRPGHCYRNILSQLHSKRLRAGFVERIFAAKLVTNVPGCQLCNADMDILRTVDLEKTRNN